LQHAQILIDRVGVLLRRLIESHDVEQWNPLHDGILIRDPDRQLILGAPVVVEQISNVEYV